MPGFLKSFLSFFSHCFKTPKSASDSPVHPKAHDADPDSGHTGPVVSHDASSAVVSAGAMVDHLEAISDPTVPSSHAYLANSAAADQATPSHASSSRLWAPSFEEVTVDALEKLIQHLEARLSHGLTLDSSDPDMSWESYTSDIPAFLQDLNKRTEVTAKGVMKDTVLPLLKEVLEGVGSLHWAAFGLSLLAWGMERLDQHHQNFEACIELLQNTLFLLKDAQSLWDHTISNVVNRNNNNLMESLLTRIAEASFRVSIISASCCNPSSSDETSKIKRCVNKLGTLFGAASLEASISEAKQLIGTLQVQSHSAALQATRNDRILSASNSFHTIDPPFGRNSQANEAEAMLKEDYKQGIMAVCLHGMGGVGKSTLANHIYNNLLKLQSHRFLSSRVEMPLKLDDKDLHLYQNWILKDISGAQHEIRGEPLRGREMLERVFQKLKNEGSHPVLLYIDNLKQPKHLEMLLPHAEHFPPGLRLLVTTRNERMSTGIHILGVEPNRCHSIKVETLNPHESRTLLRKEVLRPISVNTNSDWESMFKKEIIGKLRPDLAWEVARLEEEVLMLCDGLPLALKLMGSFIAYYKTGGAWNVEAWQHVVKSMKQARTVDGVDGEEDDKLYSSLRVSIDALDGNLKTDLFDLLTSTDFLDVDVVYPIVEQNKLIVGSVLGETRMQNLIDRHLLKDNGKGILKCHDVIRLLVKSMVSSHHDQLRITGEQLPALEDQELKNIVSLRCETSSISMENLQRLNQMKQLRYVKIKLPFVAGHEDIRVPMNLPNLKALYMYAEGDHLVTVTLGNCPELRVLIASSVQVDCQCATNLQYLAIDGGHHDIHLNLSHRHLSSLRHLRLARCLSLTTFPDSSTRSCFFSKSLQTLRIIDCGSLLQISDSIRNFSQLTELSIEECYNLHSLPETMFEEMGNNLSVLRFLGCENLKTLPEGISVLTSLTRLDLSSCKSMTYLPEGMRNLISLQSLRLSKCTNLKGFPDGMFENLANILSTLGLSSCENLEMLPEGISVLTSLTKINLSNCKSMTYLPEGMRNLISLQSLRLRNCTNLKGLPDGLFENLANSLSTLDLSGCENLEMLPEGIAVLTSLTELNLRSCKSMTYLPEGMRNLISLQSLRLRNCINLKAFPDGMFENLANSLSTLDLSDCENLEMLPEGISVLTSLTWLDLSSCKSMTYLLEGMRNLISLRYLYLWSCTNLKQLPDGMFENWANSLSTLHLRDCENLELLPEGISVLTSLTELNLSSCKSMTYLPEGMRNLINLQSLRLCYCTNLKGFPDGMFKNLANSLLTLDLSGCENLEMLPEGFSVLTSLTEINLSSCKSITYLPEGMRNLISLQSLRLSNCTNLKGFPDGMFENLANSLSTLDLSSSENIEMLPEGISVLTSLTELNLSCCKSITYLPEGMRNLISLEFLYLWSCTNLMGFPDGMFENLANSLSSLDLRDCENLKMLPEGISVLTSLTELNLSSCKSMTYLPEGMRNLISLKELRLRECSNMERLPAGLSERVGKNLVFLNLIGCGKLGFVESMTDEMLRTATCNLGLHPNQCHFLDVKTLGQLESQREEAFHLRSSFPSLSIEWIEFCLEFCLDVDMFVALLMNGVRPVRKGEGTKEVLLLY